MTTLQSEVYEAFRDLGASEDKAMKAAATLSKRDEDVTRIFVRMRVMEWMLGFVLAMQVAMFAKDFIH